MPTTYDEYLKDMGIDKNMPVKIQFSETARGFYCPTCKTGTYNKEHKCNYCGQLLLGCYGFKEEFSKRGVTKRFKFYAKEQIQ